MKIMTYYNAKEKAEQKIESLEARLDPLGNIRVWNQLMRVLRQRNKFKDRLVALIGKADKTKS